MMLEQIIMTLPGGDLLLFTIQSSGNELFWCNINVPISIAPKYIWLEFSSHHLLFVCCFYQQEKALLLEIRQDLMVAMTL